eukprot:1140082-Prymnesium_polylepis.1
MPDRTLCVLPWSCLDSLEPVRARVFWAQEFAPQMCPALGFTRVGGLDCADSEGHSPPPSSI